MSLSTEPDVSNLIKKAKVWKDINGCISSSGDEVSSVEMSSQLHSHLLNLKTTDFDLTQDKWMVPEDWFSNPDMEATFAPLHLAVVCDNQDAIKLLLEVTIGSFGDFNFVMA